MKVIYRYILAMFWILFTMYLTARLEAFVMDYDQVYEPGELSAAERLDFNMFLNFWTHCFESCMAYNSTITMATFFAYALIGLLFVCKPIKTTGALFFVGTMFTFFWLKDIAWAYNTGLPILP